MLKHPAQTGAIAPSSKALANKLAASATDADMVIELGAGTGAVTRSLVRRKGLETPLIAVELQPRLARALQRNYPQIDVRNAPAKEVLDVLLEQAPDNTLLVSSLPFRSLPREVVSETVHSLEAFLLRNPKRRLVQFTYHVKAPFAVPCGLQWRRTAVVWRNAPPASVWELRI